MKKENVKRESPYKGIFRFASAKKQQLTFSVILSVLSSIFGIVPYIAVAVLLQFALESKLTMEWVVLLPVIALCGFFLKHWLYAKSTLCSHKVAYEIIKNIRVAVMRKMSRVSMGTVQSKSSGEFKQLIMDDADRLEVPIAHAIPEMIASTLVPVLVILYLLLIDWRMALAALATGVIGNVIYYCMLIGRGEMMKEYMASNANMNATIVEYVKAFGKVDEEGIYSYEGKLSHYDIAKYLGVNRFSVTRAISKLQKTGIIKKDRRELVVLDMDYLEEL